MSATDAAPSRGLAMRDGWVAWAGLGVLVAAAVLASTDRQILNLLAEPIRRSLDFSDTRLGLLQGAGVSLFAGVFAVPIGWLADRYGRRAILAACVLVWTSATAACGLANGFAGMFAAAVGLGIGEAGLGPIVYGLIPEMFAERRRALANGVYSIAAIFGAGLGIGLSGTLIEVLSGTHDALPPPLKDFEIWRLSFLVVALPGPLVALMIGGIRLARRDRRAATDAADADALHRYLRMHHRAFGGLFGASGLGGLGIAALAAWAPVVATRLFAAAPAAVGQGIGTAYLAGTAVGGLAGGLAMKRLRPRIGVATPVRVLGIGLGLAAVAAAALLFATAAWHVYLLFGFQVAFLIAGTVVAPTMVQDMTPPPLRSRLTAIGSVITISFAAASPIVVGLASDALADRPRGLLIAVAVVASGSMALGALMTRTVESGFVATVEAIAAEDRGPTA